MSNWVTIVGNTPSKSNSYRIITLNGHGSLAKTQAMKVYENSFFMQCGDLRNLMIVDYFELHAKVFFPSMRSDLDNSLKVILDCLQRANVIKNDNLCVKIIAEKFIDKTNPRVEILITRV